MSISTLGTLFQFIGGLGMFLYGMESMADGLQKFAGNRLQRVLEILTSNRLLGVLVGAGVTAIIQSSSATTVMVVGFVNAGIINLLQATGIIMGANIGTTVTSWIVSMSEWGEVLKPEFFAPVLFGIGAFITMFAKSHKKKEGAEVLIGFALLFIGLSFMSGSIEPYRDAPIFSESFRVLGQNPLLGILVGLAVTAIIQSSSASVGILQMLAINGMAVSSLYYIGTEHRYLCDRAVILYRYDPYGKACGGHSPSVQCDGCSCIWRRFIHRVYDESGACDDACGQCGNFDFPYDI